MGALVLRPVRAVGEALGAVGELAQVRTLARVGALVDLQVLQAGERLVAALELGMEVAGEIVCGVVKIRFESARKSSILGNLRGSKFANFSH